MEQKNIYSIIMATMISGCGFFDILPNLNDVGDVAEKTGKAATTIIAATAVKDITVAKKIKEKANAKIQIDQTTASIFNDKLVYAALIQYFQEMPAGQAKEAKAEKLFKAQVEENIRNNKLQIKRFSNQYWQGGKTATIIILTIILIILLSIYLIHKFKPINTNKTYSDMPFLS